MSYPRQAVRLFCQPVRTGRRGRPRLMLLEGVLTAQRRVVSVSRQVVTGTVEAVQAALVATQGQADAAINTAYAERLNATFRARLVPLLRRTRAAAHQVATLEAGLWLVGTSYNFCWSHRSLPHERTTSDGPGGRWVEQTPAQAAGLTDHRWSLHELLTYQVPGTARKRRGRRPKWWGKAACAA